MRLFGPVDCRAMFGGHGLYCEGIFFGIIAKGRLYFRTNTTTVSDYLEWDMKPFQPNPRQKLKNYYEVPVEILEDEDQLAVWARKAVGNLP
ncbi:MAG: TfoX/Sxy family protein [Nitrospinae bacterium]|nr:TfoX/Sxy family protein [Nitrospinota bacterium]